MSTANNSMNKASIEALEADFMYLHEDAKKMSAPLMPVHRINLASECSGLLWGDEDPRIAFLHGAGLNAHAWDRVALSLQLPALAIDLPGHGHSSWRSDANYTPTSLAPEIALIFQQFPSIRHIVGHSLGGLAAIAALPELAGQTDRLILLDVTPGFQSREKNTQRSNNFMHGSQVFESREEIIQRALEFGIGSRREDLIRGVHLNTRVRADGRVEFKHHLAKLSTDAHREVDARILWTPLTSSSVPTTLIHGSRGILDHEHVEEFLARAPHPKTFVCEAGHNVHSDVPSFVASIIAEDFDSTR